MNWPPRPLATPASCPRLPRHVRLHHDRLRQAWAVLLPEKVLWPDAVSLDILRCCDGRMSIAAIARELTATYEADPDEVAADVLAFVQDWSDRMVLGL